MNIAMNVKAVIFGGGCGSVAGPNGATLIASTQVNVDPGGSESWVYGGHDFEIELEYSPEGTVRGEPRCV